ncbi:hypothetical protein FNV43_RR08606 [Rhamnella rubrinervis]|uniref:Myb-like domain-containing protein n=1 Tax=Rhamnella rubrinervis TaxID=2594499 RepID=A0A8K0H9I6_9ROSA|nr:hypothetical protein FNV43_RR08606 [Rhamnella rubrinervis]
MRTTMAASAQSQGQVQVQWSQEETKELIRIRAELERDSTVAKRGKTLWEAVSSRMLARGFSRTSDQCKCKWKNLLNRYKGKETSDPEDGRQCPFFEELHALFTERENNMKRLLLESEVGSAQSKKRVKRSNAGQSSDEFSDDEGEDEFDTDEEMPAKSNPRKRKAGKIAVDKFSRATSTAFGNGGTTIHEMLKEFFHQQQIMDIQWREMMERREYERQLFEQEWRQKMEKLERERLMVEQAWREKEEQRRMREEIRAERRDTLLTTLLDKLIHENNL